MRVGVYGFPLCFLGENFHLASEFSTVDNSEVLLGGKVDTCEEVRINFGKRKSKYCLGCKLSDICEGTWKAYYKIYGDLEFKNKKIL